MHRRPSTLLHTGMARDLQLVVAAQSMAALGFDSGRAEGEEPVGAAGHKLPEPFLPHLTRFLDHEDEDVDVAALKSLVDLKGPEVNTQLRMAMKSDDQLHRKEGLFFATLEGAPPSGFWFPMISTGRDEMRSKCFPMRRSSSLREEVWLIQFWLTYADVSAPLPLIAPSNSSLAGLALHFQRMVFSPVSFRRFELSRALTLVMRGQAPANSGRALAVRTRTRNLSRLHFLGALLE